MSEIDSKIDAMLDMPYGAELKGQSRQFICWHLCREIYKLFGKRLKLQHQTQLRKIDRPAVPCIVLFKVCREWHSGIVWPDGLHFVHACRRNVLDPQDENYVVRKDRLTGWPYNSLIEGYYTG